MSERRKVAILGAGNMGTALAHLVAGNGCRAVLWDHFPEVVEEINARKTNSRYLPGMRLADSVEAVKDRRACVGDAEVVVLAVPSPFVPAALEGLGASLRYGAVLLNVVKGIDSPSGRPIWKVVEDLLPDHAQCLLAGPAIANEFSRGGPAAVLLAARDEGARERAAALLENDAFRADVTDDMAGAALGGILKNIYALLFGYMDTAAGAGRNLEAALVAFAVGEMARIGEALGGRRETFHGLAGLGDLVATAFSEHSHNRRCGRLLGAGKSLTEVEREMKVLPEGARTAGVIVEWAGQRRLPVPFAELAHRLVTSGRFEPGALLEAFSRA